MSSTFEYTQPLENIPNLLCPICHYPFTEPCLGKQCQHFYCKACIDQHRVSSSTCPCCRTPFDDGDIVQAPRLVKLLCDELPVLCSNCKLWRGQRGDWQIHARDECGRVKEDCAYGCGEETFENQAAKDRHQAGECPRRPVTCDMCKVRLVAAELESHFESCAATTTPCPHCGEPALTRAALAVHSASVCPEVIVPCPHQRFGCEWSGKRGILRDEHTSLDCSYEPLKGLLMSHESAFAGLQLENQSLSNELGELRTMYESLSFRVEQLADRLGRESENELPLPASTILDSLSALTSQLGDLGISSERIRQSSEQSSLEVQGELSALQGAMHDLRGEVMAISQVQYYENAHKYWGRGQADPSSTTNTASTSGPSASFSSTSGSAPRPTPQPSTGPAGSLHYPYQPYMYPVYGSAYPPPPPHLLMHPTRRFYGWPYAPFGQTSPDAAPGGGTKL